MKNNFFENSRSFLAMNSLRNCFLEKIQYFFVRKASKNVKNGPPTPKIFLVIKWVKKRSGKNLASFLPRNVRFKAQKVKIWGTHFQKKDLQRKTLGVVEHWVLTFSTSFIRSRVSLTLGSTCYGEKKFLTRFSEVSPSHPTFYPRIRHSRFSKDCLHRIVSV